MRCGCPARTQVAAHCAQQDRMSSAHGRGYRREEAAHPALSGGQRALPLARIRRRGFGIGEARARCARRRGAPALPPPVFSEARCEWATPAGATSSPRWRRRRIGQGSETEIDERAHRGGRRLPTTITSSCRVAASASRSARSWRHDGVGHSRRPRDAGRRPRPGRERETTCWTPVPRRRPGPRAARPSGEAPWDALR